FSTLRQGRNGKDVQPKIDVIGGRAVDRARGARRCSNTARPGRRRKHTRERAIFGAVAEQPGLPGEAHADRMRADHRPRAPCQLCQLVPGLWPDASGDETSALKLSLEEPKMANPAPGFITRPDHRVDLLPERRHVKVVFGGVTIADSNAALRVEETGHEPVHYLPEKDVRIDLMHPTEHHTRCPYKGEASYWTIEVPAENDG